MENNKKWHSLSVKEVIKELDTDKEKGLTEKEAENKLEEYGYNRIKKKGRLTPLKILWNQFKNVMTLMLAVAIILSLIITKLTDAIVILIILVLNIVLGFFQEYRAEKALEALQSLSAPEAIVIRDDEEKEIKSKKLVPGDIVILKVGDLVPANIRLFETVNFKVNQASITGESRPVLKETDKLPASTSTANQNNMAFMSSTVTYGRAKGIVTQTGMKTEMGLIAQLVSEEEQEATPLKKEINELSKWLAMLASTAVIVLFIVGYLSGLELIKMLLTSVSLAVSAVPEGLPAIITITLSLGVKRMAGNNAIVRKLSAVQALGSVTIICSDKTGTITKNEMMVKKIFDGYKEYKVTGTGYEKKGEFLLNDEEINPQDNEQLKLLLTAGALCSTAHYDEDNEEEIIGDPTEISLLVSAEKAGIDYETLKEAMEQETEISFSSERKRMSVVYKQDGKRMVYSKGAADKIVNLCSRIQKQGEVKKLTKKKKKELIEKNKELATKGLRVLALAYKEMKNKSSEEEAIEKNLVFLGLAGMIDPPREGVEKSIKLAEKAGIKTMIITGDHELTAKAIAKEVGLTFKDEEVFTGKEVEKMSNKEFKKNVKKAVIFARISPQQKLEIIKELKNQGEIVAVTGDGVNDAPALKTADIGVAMGIKGTDVSKGASEMILSDDDYSTIIRAVKEGRVIFDNIKKFIKFLLSANTDTIIMVFISIILGLPLPLLPVQILWMNLITDGLPAIALSVDPENKDVMKRKPRNPEKSLVGEIFLFIIIAGLIAAIASIILYASTLSLTNNVVKARTMALSFSIFFELLFVFNCRGKKSVWEQGFKKNFLSNKKLTLAVISSFTLHLLVIYNPLLQSIFNTAPLNAYELLTVLSSSMIALLIIPRWFDKEVKLNRLGDTLLRGLKTD